MVYAQLLVSLILIACGFFVKRFPNLIAGYNTLSKTEKEKINIKQLSTFLKYILIGLGVVTLIIFYILDLIKVDDNNILAINSSLIVIVVIISSIMANNKFKN